MPVLRNRMCELFTIQIEGEPPLQRGLGILLLLIILVAGGTPDDESSAINELSLIHI